MILLVTGSRFLENNIKVNKYLSKFLKRTLKEHGEPKEGPALTLFVGDCPTGADYFARQWARGYPMFVQANIFHADWDTYGRVAGPIRNRSMVEHVTALNGPSYCVAFPRSGYENRGTMGCAEMAESSNIPVDYVWGV